MSNNTPQDPALTMPNAQLEQAGSSALQAATDLGEDLSTTIVGQLLPSLTRSQEMIAENIVLTLLLLVFAAGLWWVVKKLSATILRSLLQVGLAGLVMGGLVATWLPHSLAYLATNTGEQIGKSLLTIFFTVSLAALVWELISRALLGAFLGKVGTHSQRARTLQPLLRRIAAVLLGTIVTLIVLSEMGIEIAPLLAGAGVAGLAIGFGAQKLVQDFITGLSIVMEDALAIGDVVQLGAAEGTVEDMTLRTVRLRDLRGAVHIVPFSEVKIIKNYSKEFAFVLLDFGVPRGVDITKLEAKLRELTAGLAAEPAWQGVLLAPLEFMGVHQLAEDIVLVRIRQKCTPAKQWALRREMQNRMRVALPTAGISLHLPAMPQLVRDLNQTAV